MNDDMRRRWEGGDIDLTKRLPSDLILAAAGADPAIAPAIRPYLQIAAGPSSLDGVEARARALYPSGWRPRLGGPEPQRARRAGAAHHRLQIVGKTSSCVLTGRCGARLPSSLHESRDKHRPRPQAPQATLN
jgi:hypothetical protein